MSKKYKQRGFGLIEILVFVGILSIVILAFLKLFRTSASFQRNLVQKGENIELQDTIELFLRDPVACPKLFNNQVISLVGTTILPRLFRPNGAVLIEVTKLYGQLKVDNIQMKTPTLLEGTRYHGELVVDVSKFGQPVMANPSYHSEFDVIFTVDATNKIISCEMQAAGGGDTGGGLSVTMGYLLHNATINLGPATEIQHVLLTTYASHIPQYISKQANGTLRVFYRTGPATTSGFVVDGTYKTICVDSCSWEGPKARIASGNLQILGGGGDITHWIKYSTPPPP